MNSDAPFPPHPPPPASTDQELVAFLAAAVPRRLIPRKVLREAYAQIAPPRLLGTSAISFACGFAMPLILVPDMQMSWRSLIPVVLCMIMLAVGMLTGLLYFKKRAYCRKLLETGVMDEFQIVDFEIHQQQNNHKGVFFEALLQAEKVPLIHVYHLKPANRNGDAQAYFSQFTKENHIAYADAVHRSKTTTFGLYDPTARAARHHVLMIEAWFHEA